MTIAFAPHIDSHCHLPRPSGATPLYTTSFGEAYVGDSLVLLKQLPAASVNLVITSPPFALTTPKAYGNVEEAEYVAWFLPFAQEVGRVLKPNGSFVVELGWTYRKGSPTRSLYNVELLVRLCREQHWLLCQEFYWFNPTKLPTPAEWVTIRRVRMKDACSPFWWFAKTEAPQAHWGGITVADDLNGESGQLSDETQMSLWGDDPRFQQQDNDVSSNLLEVAHTESNSFYQQCCRRLGVNAHPARFPAQLPAFFLRGLTRPGDVVVDVFAGSNTTGAVAERLGRHWLSFELRQDYAAASALRFLQKRSFHEIQCIYQTLMSGIGFALPDVQN